MLNATFSVNFKHCTVFLQKATFSGIQSWTLCLIFPQVFWMMIDFPCWKGIVFWLAWLLEASSGEVLEALLLARPGRVVRSVHAILDWPSSRVSNLCFRERMAPGGSFLDDQRQWSPRPSTPCCLPAWFALVSKGTKEIRAALAQRGTVMTMNS